MIPQYLQKNGIFPKDPDPKVTAIFLRNTIGLNKFHIGEILGDPGDFNLKVLDEFVNTFNFQGTPFIDALRSFLESFRLPGEAQKISRILEVA